MNRNASLFRNALFAALAVMFFTAALPAFAVSGTDSYILKSVLEISGTIRSEFYAGVSEKTLFEGAMSEISKKFDTGGVGAVSNEREFSSAFLSLLSRHGQSKGDIGELAVRGMIKSLDDPYSLFLDTRQWDYFRRVSAGEEFTGIGVELAKKNGAFVIVSPVEGGSAALAGIRPGDVIVKAAGRNVSGMDDMDVLALFDGRPGTFMTLTVRRGSALKEFKVKRTVLSLKAPSASILKSGTAAGYLRISYFSEKTDSEAAALMEKMRKAGVKNLIIDLRNNPGGEFKSSVSLASMFAGRKTIVTKVMNGGKSSRVKGPGDARFSFRTVILVNKGTASASEVFSGAMQDYGLARLVGERSFGKALIQSVYSLPGNAGCKITTARYYTAKGRDILNRGLDPDTVVNDAYPRAKASEDPCVRAALRLFSGK